MNRENHVNSVAQNTVALLTGILSQLPAEYEVKVDTAAILNAITYRPDSSPVIPESSSSSLSHSTPAAHRMSVAPWPLAPAIRNTTMESTGVSVPIPTQH